MGTWQEHYQRKKSELTYPDENLVRLLARALREKGAWQSPVALDLGCGSGRHLALLKDFGFSTIVGSDNSIRALELSQETGGLLFQGDNRALPLRDRSCHLVVAWGSLHYAPKNDLPLMLKEVSRILSDNGLFVGTLRRDNDTYMKRGKHLGNNVWQTELNDIAGTVTAFYSEEELKNYFSIFSSTEYGTAERSPLGTPQEVISHWVFYSSK